MAEKKKRKPVAPKSDIKAPPLPARKKFGEDVEEREEFGETTFAGALAAVKGVLEKATGPTAPVKPGKKG